MNGFPAHEWQMKKHNIFLIFCLFVFQANAKTDCEKSKLTLGKTKAAWEKNKAIKKKTHEVHLKFDVAFQNTYYSWKRALQTWFKANKDDSVARAAWQKADKAYEEAFFAWKKSEIATKKAYAKLNSISEKIFQEAKKIKTEVIKFCEVDNSKTKLIFPSWASNPGGDITIAPFISINSQTPKKKLSDGKVPSK